MKKGVQFIFFCLISLQLFAQNDTIKIGQLLISKPDSKSNLSWEQIIKNKELKGLKVKQILVFCKNQSVLRESYYGIEHNSNGIEHISNGRTHQQRY